MERDAYWYLTAPARARWREAWRAIRTLARYDGGRAAPWSAEDQSPEGLATASACACASTLLGDPAMGRRARRARLDRYLRVDWLEWRRDEDRPYWRIRHARLPLAELEGRCPDCRWPYRTDGCQPGLCSQVEF